MSTKGVRISNEEARKLMTTKGLALPLEEYPGAHNRWKCKCLRCDEIVYPRLAKINSGQSACKSCGIAAFAEKRMLSDPEAREKMISLGVIPDKDSPYPGALKPWKSTCALCKRAISPRYANVLNVKNPCIYCSKRKRHPGETLNALKDANLELLNPNLSMDAQVYECKCLKCGNKIAVWWSTISRGGNPCKYCAQRAVLPADAKSIMIAADLKPLADYPGASSPWESQCKRCKKIVAPSLSAVKNGASCGYCAGNRIDEVDVREAFTKAFLKPLEGFTNASTPWKSKCLKCGNEVSPIPTRVLSGTGCKYCMGVAVDPDTAVQIMIKKNVQPLEPYPGSHSPWSCKCLKCGQITSPTFHKVSRRETGCRYCARRGPDLKAPTYLYFIENRELSAYKIGVAKVSSTRIKQHTNAGWRVLKSFYFLTGEGAYGAESEVLRWWRKELLLPPFLEKNQIPHGGWTETISRESLGVRKIMDFLDDLIDLHENSTEVPKQADKNVK